MGSIQRGVRPLAVSLVLGAVACSPTSGENQSPQEPSDAGTDMAGEPNSEPYSLIVKSQVAAPVELPARALQTSARVVAVDPLALEHRRIALNVEGEVMIAEQTGSQEILNRRVWTGRLEGSTARDNQVVLTAVEGSVVGWIQHDGRLQEIEPLADGRHLSFETDAGALPECAEDLESEGAHTADHDVDDGDGALFDALEGAGDDALAPTRVDALILYTPAARQRYGRSGIESRILSAVASANLAYQNSDVNMELELVHMEEVDYTEGSISTSLNRIRSKTDGYMDNVHALRDSVGADVVALVSEDEGACGIGSLMTNVSDSFESRAFSVTASGCLSNHTLAHEFGHNMGSAHNRENGSRGAYSYSFGYRHCSSYRTVMAYSCGSPRRPYFSNPDIYYRDLPTGTSTEDNARSLNNVKSTVAGWRDTVSAECAVNQDCADGDICTSDTCDNGVCEHSLNSASCDDGNSCTSNDQCSGGSCQGSPNGACLCGPGEVGHDGHCYAAITATRTYDEALDACEGRGAGWSLAKVTSSGENDFVRGLLSGDRWIGASDSQTEGQFFWVDGEALGGYSAWVSGEPSNTGGSGAADCVRMLANGEWRDYSCTGAFAAVCESDTVQAGCVADAECDDGNPCTTNTCSGGECQAQNNSGGCTLDGDACTDDVCQGGVCTHPDNGSCECVTDADCSDGNACTDDSCNAGSCSNTNHSRGCADDGDSCTADVCAAGACSHPDNGSCTGGELTGSVTISNQWESGYCAEVTIANKMSGPIDSWNLVLDLDGASLDGAWNANVSQVGSRVSATNVSWNGTIQAGQRLNVFGYCAATAGDPGNPAVVSVVAQ